MILRLFLRATIRSPWLAVASCRSLTAATGADEAVVQQVVADAARHLPGLLPGAGQQQGVLAREVVSEERAAGQLHRLLGVAAAEPALLFVQGQRRRCPRRAAAAWRRVPIPG